ncbi:MAG TPA: amidohydrolase [Niabella sp.]|nr:amidohydrolase [Niabella sp.]HQW13346.1 amidohydrolase [Niabella sp.]HQX18614.1 amidohydrolase [Niabella sp.]HQX42270.1 amidohydrolase [Niabella sp.]HRB06511.1 amidohydrolase [Niabella sp.]
MRIIFYTLVLCLVFSCNRKEQADLLVYNATIYTLDSTFSKADAMVVENGKIVATGHKDVLQNRYNTIQQLDAAGKFIYPGFIDAHAHFVGYAKGLTELNLTETKSWEEIVKKLDTHKSSIADTTSWIIGRGWDQNDWPDKAFPNNEKLNTLFPNQPVYLVRIDGHAAIANNKALELAFIKPEDKITGGEYVTNKGKLTGLLIDNALNKVVDIIPDLKEDILKAALVKAQQNCFAQGLTSIHDCGLDFKEVERIEQFQKLGDLRMRLYILLSDAPKNYQYLTKRGTIKTDYLSVRGFKLYADGALGSRGACLLHDYTDKPGWKGFLLSTANHFDSMAAVIARNKWQMCTHAIGDSGIRTMLKIYAKHLMQKNDLRWRIEHAQVVDKDDFHFFEAYSIIPSVQPTHATSDMYWADDRLGQERIQVAYAYQQLLQQNNWLPLGTDFPVEDISPFKTFYAAVVRKDAKGDPADGFQKENALTREQVLRGMTIWAAKAAFEEKEKGSLERGKFADFIILDKDLMNVAEKDLLNIKVLKTYLGGEPVFIRKQ